MIRDDSDQMRRQGLWAAIGFSALFWAVFGTVVLWLVRR